MDSEIREVLLTTGKYTMMVNRIQEDRKTFARSGMTQHVHDIYFFSDDGLGYRGEYITTAAHQADFVAGQKRCFEVTNEKMREIMPCSVFSTGAEPVVNNPFYKKKEADDDFDPSPINVAGKSYCFAMGYAKDIAVARIRGGHCTGEEPDFMSTIKAQAWEMHQWMLNPTPLKEEDPF